MLFNLLEATAKSQRFADLSQSLIIAIVDTNFFAKAFGEGRLYILKL